MARIMEHNDKKSGMTPEEIQSTFAFLVIAGSETTATLLSAAVNKLLDRRDVLANLTKEIRGRFPEESEISLDGLASMPLLNAVLEESLRLCPPVPTILPRLVPEGGEAMCGVWIPGRVSPSLAC